MSRARKTLHRRRFIAVIAAASLAVMVFAIHRSPWVIPSAIKHDVSPLDDPCILLLPTDTSRGIACSENLRTTCSTVAANGPSWSKGRQSDIAAVFRSCNWIEDDEFVDIVLDAVPPRYGHIPGMDVWRSWSASLEASLPELKAARRTDLMSRLQERLRRDVLFPYNASLKASAAETLDHIQHCGIEAVSDEEAAGLVAGVDSEWSRSERRAATLLAGLGGGFRRACAHAHAAELLAEERRLADHADREVRAMLTSALASLRDDAQ